MIPLLPYKRLVFESPLSQEELLQRLMLEVAKPSFGLQWFEKRTEKFQGTVSAEGFQISRIIRYRNSFLPVIQGRFASFGPGTRVEVSMRLHMVVIIFCLIWLSFVGGVSLLIIPQILITGSLDTGGGVPLFMLLFFYLMVTIGFGIEANKASKLLRDIFEIKEKESY